MRVEDAKVKAKKGFLSIIFSRSVIFLILLIVQVAVFSYTIIYLADEYQSIFYMITIGVNGLVVLWIINKKGNPAFKLAWIIPILLLPVLGALYYMFCMLQLTPKVLARRLSILWVASKPFMGQDEKALNELKSLKSANARLAHFMSKQVGFPVHRNTEVTYFPLGEDKLRELLFQLNKAEKFIFLEYFIIEKGLMWASILHVLEKKVKEGVEVRVMYDGTCSMGNLPPNYPKYLKSIGIKCKIFNQIKPFWTTYQNNRDHRKICVIDGKIAFTGGVNLGDEYINQVERFGHWKDTAIMLRGEGVQSLTMMFLQMWNIKEKRAESYLKYTTPKKELANPQLGFVLPYGDSPYDNENVGEAVYLHIINHAKKYVHITTPYLILDHEMVSSLSYAAKSGVEVIIIMPHIPDKRYAFELAKTYYLELLEAGVHIYEYTPGFIHAKMFVSDDDTATVGTVNLDYRSLYLHFECGAFIYNNPVVKEIEKDFQNTLKLSQKILLKDVKSRSYTSKAMGRVLRLIAPLM